MSNEFRVPVSDPVARSVVDGGRADVRWSEEAPDPLGPGRWHLHLDRISTRVTTVDYDGGWLAVTVRAGASVEDCGLALDIVRRMARAGDGRIGTEVGELEVRELDEVETWMRSQVDSAARVVMELFGSAGPSRCRARRARSGSDHGPSLSSRPVIRPRPAPASWP
ncbi:MAG: hypothetical protein ACRD12_23080 [Acidimicrobiales bacterium]